MFDEIATVLGTTIQIKLQIVHISQYTENRGFKRFLRKKKKNYYRVKNRDKNKMK